MRLKQIFSRWPQIAGLVLISGSIAWTLKLGVIISTNGRIIDTGAAAFLMTTGLLLLLIGSTGIGYRISLKYHPAIRTVAILFSPVLLFATILFFSYITGPLFLRTTLWYAEQEAPIAVAVIVSFIAGFLLYRNREAVKGL